MRKYGIKGLITGGLVLACIIAGLVSKSVALIKYSVDEIKGN